MPAFLSKILQWFLAFFVSHIVEKLKDYIEKRKIEKELREAKKKQIEFQVKNLQNARTKKEFDDAARDILDDF